MKTYELLIERPEGPSRRVELTGERYSMGRAHSNDLCYAEDASLSRNHMVLEREDDSWYVRDEKSKNGTLLNGVRISDARKLHPNDRLSAGQLTITLVDPDAGPPDDRVVFVPEAGPELLPSATVMTSLQGLLSGEATAPIGRGNVVVADRRQFDSPVVRALIRAGRELAQHRPMEELFQLILDLSIEAVAGERGVVMTSEGGQLVPRAVHGEGFRISTTVRDRVINEKTSLLVRDLEQEDALRMQKSLLGQQVQSLMAAPLQTENKVIGLIYVDASVLGRKFDKDDLNLLTVLANHAAIRIEQERFRELQNKDRIRSRDLEQAAEIQRGILPKSAPVVAGLDLAGYNAACRTVGGDYYDFLRYPEGRIGIVLGDVAGKGMSAALLMSNLQARVQLLAATDEGLGTLMERLDQSIALNCPTNRFITLFVSVIDPAGGVMRYCNAGHNPPMLIRADGRIELLSAVGTVLGILPELGYEEQAVVLEPGDLLAVFSDGLTEATAAGDDAEFGEDRLAELICGVRERPAAEIIETVNSEIDRFTGGAPPVDDVTLVIARRVD